MTTVSEKSWKDKIVEFFTSPSGLMSTISGVGLIITAVVLSKLGEPSVFDDNLYKDRLRRSTIQLLILSVLGFVLGIYLKHSDLTISAVGDRQSMTTILAIGILMMAVTADMVNSFKNISGVDSLVQGLIATMLTVSIIVVIYALYKLFATTDSFKKWRSGSSGLATPSEPSTPESITESVAPSLANFIMY
jgi:hypothetical protein